MPKPTAQRPARADRRAFLRQSAATSLGGLLLGLQGCDLRHVDRPAQSLRPDPDGLCDLPPGFTYRVISARDEVMSDGLTVPGRHDGMGCFAGPDGHIILVRNHEALTYLFRNPKSPAPEFAYDRDASGGTTTVWLDADLNVAQHYLSLTGTIRNCGGGSTPWGTWISCEEAASQGWMMGERHGYAFEVHPEQPLMKSAPLRAMGRFNREAVAVDPASGIVYQTEDAVDGCFYRFIPNKPGQLAEGGTLQALAVQDAPRLHTTRTTLAPGVQHRCHWVTLEQPDPQKDTLRLQSQRQGAAVFVRGEGIVARSDGLYFACTDGGTEGIGQIFRYQPEDEHRSADSGGQLALVYEARDAGVLHHPDNITVSPWGDLIVCEDGNLPQQRLLGVTAAGTVYAIAGTMRSEWCGACFSPDGTVLFANIQENPGLTVAITGPWHALSAQAQAGEHS